MDISSVIRTRKRTSSSGLRHFTRQQSAVAPPSSGPPRVAPSSRATPSPSGSQRASLPSRPTVTGAGRNRSSRGTKADSSCAIGGTSHSEAFASESQKHSEVGDETAGHVPATPLSPERETATSTPQASSSEKLLRSVALRSQSPPSNPLSAEDASFRRIQSAVQSVTRGPGSCPSPPRIIAGQQSAASRSQPVVLAQPIIPENARDRPTRGPLVGVVGTAQELEQVLVYIDVVASALAHRSHRVPPPPSGTSALMSTRDLSCIHAQVVGMVQHLAELEQRQVATEREAQSILVRVQRMGTMCNDRVNALSSLYSRNPDETIQNQFRSSGVSVMGNLKRELQRHVELASEITLMRMVLQERDHLKARAIYERHRKNRQSLPASPFFTWLERDWFPAQQEAQVQQPVPPESENQEALRAANKSSVELPGTAARFLREVVGIPAAQAERAVVTRKRAMDVIGRIAAVARSGPNGHGTSINIVELSDALRELEGGGETSQDVSRAEKRQLDEARSLLHALRQVQGTEEALNAAVIRAKSPSLESPCVREPDAEASRSAEVAVQLLCAIHQANMMLVEPPSCAVSRGGPTTLQICSPTELRNHEANSRVLVHIASHLGLCTGEGMLPTAVDTLLCVIDQSRGRTFIPEAVVSTIERLLFPIAASQVCFEGALAHVNGAIWTAATTTAMYRSACSALARLSDMEESLLQLELSITNFAAAPQALRPPVRTMDDGTASFTTATSSGARSSVLDRWHLGSESPATEGRESSCTSLSHTERSDSHRYNELRGALHRARAKGLRGEAVQRAEHLLRSAEQLLRRDETVKLKVQFAGEIRLLPIYRPNELTYDELSSNLWSTCLDQFRRQHRLPDGAAVELGAGSHLRIRYADCDGDYICIMSTEEWKIFLSDCVSPHDTRSKAMLLCDFVPPLQVPQQPPSAAATLAAALLAVARRGEAKTRIKSPATATGSCSNKRRQAANAEDTRRSPVGGERAVQNEAVDTRAATGYRRKASLMQSSPPSAVELVASRPGDRRPQTARRSASALRAHYLDQRAAARIWMAQRSSSAHRPQAVSHMVDGEAEPPERNGATRSGRDMRSSRHVRGPLLPHDAARPLARSSSASVASSRGAAAVATPAGELTGQRHKQRNERSAVVSGAPERPRIDAKALERPDSSHVSLAQHSLHSSSTDVSNRGMDEVNVPHSREEAQVQAIAQTTVMDLSMESLAERKGVEKTLFTDPLEFSAPNAPDGNGVNTWRTAVLTATEGGSGLRAPSALEVANPAATVRAADYAADQQERCTSTASSRCIVIDGSFGTKRWEIAGDDILELQTVLSEVPGTARRRGPPSPLSTSPMAEVVVGDERPEAALPIRKASFTVSYTRTGKQLELAAIPGGGEVRPAPPRRPPPVPASPSVKDTPPPAAPLGRGGMAGSAPREEPRDGSMGSDSAGSRLASVSLKMLPRGRWEEDSYDMGDIRSVYSEGTGAPSPASEFRTDRQLRERNRTNTSTRLPPSWNISESGAMELSGVSTLSHEESGGDFAIASVVLPVDEGRAMECPARRAENVLASRPPRAPMATEQPPAPERPPLRAAPNNDDLVEQFLKLQLQYAHSWGSRGAGKWGEGHEGPRRGGQPPHDGPQDGAAAYPQRTPSRQWRSSRSADGRRTSGPSRVTEPGASDVEALGGKRTASPSAGALAKGFGTSQASASPSYYQQLAVEAPNEGSSVAHKAR